MDQKSQIKVMAAGFTIIRFDDQPTIRIKHKTAGAYEWKTLSKHETKAAREGERLKLIEDPFIIED
jgi:hypothetical protein